MTELKTHKKYKPEAVALTELHRFIYEYDPRAVHMPKRIEPALVERFLRDELGKGRPRYSDEAARMIWLSDFYNTRGVVPSFIGLLTGKELTDDEFLTSVVFAVGVSYLGNDVQWNFGRAYYHYLISISDTPHRLSNVVTCYEAYAPRETVDALAKRIDDMMASVQQQATADDRARKTLNDLQNIRANRLPRLLAGLAAEMELAGITVPATRISRLVEIYLDLDEGHNEILGQWAERQLRREAREGRAALIVSTLRHAIPRLAGREDKDESTARAVHAIEFFGGKLSVEEQKHVRPSRKWLDPLSE